MKSNVIILGILLGSIFLSCKSTVGTEVSTIDEQTISSTLIKLTEDWVTSIQNDDNDQLDEILSEAHVYHRDNGEVWNKEKVLKHYIDGVPDFDTTYVFDLKVHVYSNDLAMIMGKSRFVFHNDAGELIDATTVWSNLYKDEDGTWRCTFGTGCAINISE